MIVSPPTNQTGSKAAERKKARCSLSLDSDTIDNEGLRTSATIAPSPSAAAESLKQLDNQVRSKTEDAKIPSECLTFRRVDRGYRTAVKLCKEKLNVDLLAPPSIGPIALVRIRSPIKMADIVPPNHR
ncbi:hypothetical protein J6590_042557 [Homalodisca vitripennis]|nr:hypothetical protein J6590_042557 [Homalodisca vitripennis]